MLHIFTQNDINDLVHTRDGETKLGETVTVLDDEKDFFEEVENNTSKFVLIGVPEDIGVKMNGGKGGAHTSFFPALQAFLNTQENQFISGKDILVLGYLDFLETVETFVADDPEKGDYLVKQIDKELSELIHFVVSIGKTPIVIGGGHNNAYGNIKGLSTAKKEAINVVNLDAHTDLRRLEERHSGNGFSYAIHDGFLDHYFMFGLHENYTPQYIFEYIHDHINIEYNMFEELEIYQSTSFERELQRAENFIQEKPFGVEIDLDCIQYFPSSAMTPSGFTPQQARKFVHHFGKNKQVSYLHICEGAPTVMNEPIAATQVGKFISYLITDFLKAKSFSG
ncbi:formiminoglutamase [Tenacibaculum adriaticum]|uniref:Formiminoglutamase n=1 Tax=Tenacibaculum adriaticum TaxID=413713 RepID=A0A5S5DX27_9FLAO|nr:formimidoylglutamase [Tenacibaculum adriaticum]TYP99342.1 formiminoglutamase [Tenacibaculum adriaticum]